MWCGLEWSPAAFVSPSLWTEAACSAFRPLHWNRGRTANPLRLSTEKLTKYLINTVSILLQIHFTFVTAAAWGSSARGAAWIQMARDCQCGGQGQNHDASQCCLGQQWEKTREFYSITSPLKDEGVLAITTTNSSCPFIAAVGLPLDPIKPFKAQASLGDRGINFTGAGASKPCTRVHSSSGF